MKISHLIIAASVAALSSTGALAESTDTVTVNMTGNVEQICTAVPNTGIAGSNVAGLNYSAADDNVNVTYNFGIANTNNPTLSTIGQTNQAFFSVGFKTFCNDDFTVTVQPENGTFANPATAPAGFVNALPYGYTLKKIGGNSVSVGTASTASTALTSTAFNGTTQIDVGVKPSTTPPVAGDYSEKLTITFAADSNAV